MSNHGHVGQYSALPAKPSLAQALYQIQLLGRMG